MFFPRLRSVLLIVSLTLFGSLTAHGEDHYLFSYFTGNGEDGLHLAHSTDGIAWTALNGGKSFLMPAIDKDKLMRDPSIVQGPDGTFHMVWTSGWNDQGIGVAHSKDLIHWTEQKRVGVMDHEATARNCWAPEIFYDDATSQYLIMWATTIPGRFPETDDFGDNGLNHRMYLVTTKDFETYSETKPFFDPGFSVIDSFLIHDGGSYVLITKDETRYPEAEKNLFVATAKNAVGPYTVVSDKFSPDWVEGPSLLKVGERWLIYYDEYRDRHYSAMQTTDFKTFQPLDTPLTYPKGMRHGTTFKVSADIAQALLDYDGPEVPGTRGAGQSAEN